jgi:hypothetical protein
MPPKLVNTKVIRGPFEWEQNVTGDCRPCDVLVPFTYVKNRVYVEADDKNNKNGKKKDKKKNERRFTEETRYEFRRCTCARSIQEPLSVGKNCCFFFHVRRDETQNYNYEGFFIYFGTRLKFNDPSARKQ